MTETVITTPARRPRSKRPIRVSVLLRSVWVRDQRLAGQLLPLQRTVILAVRGARKAAQERRLRALLAVAKGEHVPRVAKTLSVAERAVRNWVHRYNRGGDRHGDLRVPKVHQCSGTRLRSFFGNVIGKFRQADQ